MNPLFEVWIGLLEVKELNGSGVLEGVRGAYCNVLAVAKDLETFEAVVEAHALKCELEMLRLSEAEPLKRRMSKHTIAEEILLLGQEVERNGRPAFTTFHSFGED